MRDITSPSNEIIKKTVQYASKASARKEDGVFVAEGTKLVTEAPSSSVRRLFVSESCLSDLQKEKGRLPEAFEKLCASLDSGDVIKLPDHVFEKLSTMKTPQGMLAVIDAPSFTEDDVCGKGVPLILVLEDIQDPGNVGTIFRTAEAAGVSGIILTPGCADPLSPKVVRSSMGAIFRVPFIIEDDLPGCILRLEEKGINCFAARLDAAESYDKCDLAAPCALLIGNEGNGLSKEVIDKASKGIFIPMSGKTESLNAAVSASILSYEARRQRSND
ncbi:MAG: RNA methyltransferase [Lachnospiraceae bacterium]|nr:RNA methyltransferase [Lachnospiraceae bacterium]